MLVFRDFFWKKWDMGIENLDLEKMLESSFLVQSSLTSLWKSVHKDFYETKSFYLLILYFATGQRNVKAFSSK